MKNIETIEETYGDPYTALWASVMVQGIMDMDSHVNSDRDSARRWYWEDAGEIGSFSWICEMLDLNFERLQFACMSREGRANLLRRIRII